ncbi:hypothetical protein ACFCX0_46475 [Streptomyces sp. NPDC056352]|uniref:hypothetical protein n=1 Tax=Streptomyces sp. NPDC056352 TaxID=3345791 RepID=UPI0035DC0D17
MSSSATLAANWAETVSAVGTAAGVLVTALAGWWAWRAAVPQRKLAYSIEVTPLLSSTHSGLTVSLGAERVAQPHTATLKVINVGNREIQASNYNGEPIEFGMNARVVSVLASQSTDNRRVAPSSIHGNTLQIDPYVIHKGQVITYKLLLDGADPKLTLRHSLSARFKPDTREKRSNYWAVGGMLAVASVLVITGIFQLKSTHTELEKAKDTVDETAQKDRQTWYEKGKREGERAAREAGEAGSPSQSSSPTASPSPSQR